VQQVKQQDADSAKKNEAAFSSRQRSAGCKHSYDVELAS
jgi:hypothetical protein